VKAPSGTSLELDADNKLPWLLVLSGDMEVCSKGARLELPYTDDFRDQIVLVIVGRSRGSMVMRAHEVTPSGWINYSNPSAPPDSSAVNPLAYVSETMGFRDIRQVHVAEAALSLFR